MSVQAVKTISVSYPGGIGNPKLDKVFADAEKWTERDEGENGWTVAWRSFVRHPRYPECTLRVEATMIPMEGAGPGVTRVTVKRVISDNGKTPVSAIGQIARYSTLVTDFHKRQAGPKALPERDRLRIVRGWRQVKGRVLQRDYAEGQWVSPRILRRWERELEEQGKL